MEFITFLLILALVFIAIKLMSLVFRAGIYLLSIPLQILIGAFVVLLLGIILPITIISGLLPLLFVTLAILVPLFPLFLIGLGIYMLARK
jgi:hypothetical protein